MKRLGMAAVMLVALTATARAQKTGKTVAKEPPAEQRAPKGMCRIWLKDVPAAQQPAPTDCAAAVKNCPPNGRVIFGDADETKTRPKADTTSGDGGKTPPVKSFTGQKRTNSLIKPPILPRKPPE